MFFHLEPEWVAVVLVALVYSGDIVLNLGGQETMDSGTIERAATQPITALTDFRFYARPRTLPLNVWVAIFEGLGLSPGLIKDENTRKEAVERLQTTVQAEMKRAAEIQNRLQQGPQLWNVPVFTDRVTIVSQAGTVVAADLPEVPLHASDLLAHVRGYTNFLQELSHINTIGKLRNLRLTAGRIEEALADRKVVDRADQFLALVGQLQPLTTYLAEAQANLPADSPWSQAAAVARQNLLHEVRRFAKAQNGRPSQSLINELDSLKKEYVSTYAEQHRRLALGPQADDRRQRLMNDARLRALNELARIELLNIGELSAWKSSLAALPTCREFHDGVLATSPTCPNCHLRPAQQLNGAAAEQVLSQLDLRLDDFLHRWRQGLRANLQSETARRSLDAMTPAERQPIEQFLDQGDDDPTIPPGFVDAAIQALRGIEAVTLQAGSLLDALKTGGLPCTKSEMERRFAEFLRQALRGHDANSVRLTLADS